MNDKNEIRLTNRYIMVPTSEIDISRIGFFDELEYDLWHVIKNYFAELGIELVSETENSDDFDEDEPDWEFVKSIQDDILTKLEQAGIKFKYNN